MIGSQNPIICLTFDIDWAADFIINDTINLLDKYGVKATFFSTHQTTSLKGLDVNKYEVGLHPNFNPLLKGAGDDFVRIINDLWNCYPDSVGMRSHSLVQGGSILQYLIEQKFFYDSNIFLPYQSIRPYFLKKFLRIPFNWEDDVHYYFNRPFTLDNWNFFSKPMTVFNFHPIHLFLNSENADRYVKSKKFSKDFSQLQEYQNKTSIPGARNYLMELLSWIKESKTKTLMLKELYTTMSDGTVQNNLLDD